MEAGDHHLALACHLGRMMTAAMTVETEDITLVTVHAAAAAGDNLKFIFKSCVLRTYLWHGIFKGKGNIPNIVSETQDIPGLVLELLF